MMSAFSSVDVWRILRAVMLLYLLVCAGLLVFQRSLLYYPRRTDVREIPLAAKPAYAGRALVVDPPGPIRATAILFHGNAGAAVDRMFYSEELARRGVQLVLAEYPGYGWRRGSISESSLVLDGKALYEEVRSSVPKDRPVIVIGESLGTGVATQVAATAEVQPQKLVLITPYSSMADVAQEKFWYLPARYLLCDSFDSAKHVAAFKGAISLLIAADDEVIGAASGRQLAKVAARPQLTVFDLAGAGHNTWERFVPPAFWDAF
jgi:fermentation-respiration switch protein FrsA (DUF1100 family)